MRTGLTRVEVFVIIGILVLVACVAVPLLMRRSPVRARSVMDASQIKQVHQAILAKAMETKGGRMALPSLTSEPEDFSLNSTQNLFSMLLAQNLVGADLLVSPLEVNPQVIVLKNYNHDSYQPAQGRYWDPSFEAEIDAPTGSDKHSNVSYAHLVLCGTRVERDWRNGLDSNRPHLSTQGPRDGVTTGPEFENSPTLKLLPGPRGTWRGNICFADNHMEFVETFTPENVHWSCGSIPLRLDNIFSADFTEGDCVPTDERGVRQLQGGGDAWLGICPRGMGKYTAGPAWDALLP